MLRRSSSTVWHMARIAALALLSLLTLAGCDGLTAAPAARTAAPSALFLPRCASSVRPQAELDVAGLPPLVPADGVISCLLNASNGGPAFDAGYDASIALADGRVLHLHERRGGLPAKDGAPASLGEGQLRVGDTTWRWTILPGPTASLTNTMNRTYVELDLPGDETQLDALSAIAASLRPVESLARPPAREICATLRVSSGPSTVAAAFDSTADAVARWQETPQRPDGPYETMSAWRQHPPAEPVAVCYLDGDFGPAKHPPLLSGATEPPNWSRVVYLVGVNRQPIGFAFGWRDRIPIVDPGR